MLTLNFHRDSFDQDNTFTFAYEGRRGEVTATGYLFDGKDEGLYIMKRSACLKASYTDADIAEQRRLDAQIPVRNGDIVEVNGQQYKVTILGNYSDAGRLTKV